MEKLLKLQAQVSQLQAELARSRKETGDLEDRLLIATDHATFDPRTRLYRREVFEDTVREMLGGGVSGAFVLIDLQGFGAINEEFGHPTGDQMIAHAADAIRRRMRVRKRVHRLEDSYCRLGGDEFAALLAEVSEDQVVQIVGAINAEAQKIDRRLMFHYGYAICKPEDTFETLYERADQYLWTYKEQVKSEKRRKKAEAIIPEISPLILNGRLEEATQLLADLLK